MQAVLDQVKASLDAHVPPGATLCVAFSGGMDSMVLLDALHRLNANIRNPVSALHVHHGLNRYADLWATFCAEQCEARGVPLTVRHVVVARDGGGTESAAREARYAAYRDVDAAWILQAHHADDMAETLLLRLVRGAGVGGMAGMPVVRALDEMHRLLRPLLAVPRSDLHAYAMARDLKWVEDESNADTQLDRNYVRHEVLPRIAVRFPSYRTNWMRTARHIATSQRLLDELAVGDVGTNPHTLSLARLRSLSSDRLQNALRYFFRMHGLTMPDTGLVDDLERKLRGCGPEAALGTRVGAMVLYRYRDAVTLVPLWMSAGPGPFELGWHGEPEMTVPPLRGRLCLRPTLGAGMRASLVAKPGWCLRGHRDGERLRQWSGGPSRTLKNLFQSAGVPPWLRAWQPRLAHQGKLVWVAGLGIDADWQAAPGEPGVVPEWKSESTPVLVRE